MAGAAGAGRNPEGGGARQQATGALRTGPQVPRAGRDFSIEDGELTATMKVRRARVMENFRESIEDLYAGKEVLTSQCPPDAKSFAWPPTVIPMQLRLSAAALPHSSPRKFSRLAAHGTMRSPTVAPRSNGAV